MQKKKIKYKTRYIIKGAKGSFFILVLFLNVLGHAMTFDSKLIVVHKKILSLDLKNANTELISFLKTKPNESYANYLLAKNEALSIICFEQMSSLKNKQNVIKQCLTKLNTSTLEDNYIRFMKADIHITLAIGLLKMNQITQSALHFKTGNHIINEIYKKDKTWAPNLAYKGFIEAFAGTLPNSYQWLASIIGINANFETGFKKIKLSISKQADTEIDKLFYKQSKIIEAFAYYYLNKDVTKALSLILEISNSYKTNTLELFLRTYFEIKSKNNDEAIKLFESCEFKKSSEQLPYLNYVYGTCLIHKLDNKAIAFLENYINTNSNASYVKSAQYHLSLMALLANNYADFMKLKTKINTIGQAQIDDDKQAQRFCKSNDIPNINLLKVRFLYDGGYFNKALLELKNKSENDYSDINHQIEYNYRMGRINAALKKWNLAKVYFDRALKIGKSSERYFAMASAIELGIIFENENNKVMAKQYYQLALNNKANKEYRNGLEQKAKSGLQRLKK